MNAELEAQPHQVVLCCLHFREQTEAIAPDGRH